MHAAVFLLSAGPSMPSPPFAAATDRLGDDQSQNQHPFESVLTTPVEESHEFVMSDTRRRRAAADGLRLDLDCLR
jgi:hypothetical protein